MFLPLHSPSRRRFRVLARPKIWSLGALLLGSGVPSRAQNAVSIPINGTGAVSEIAAAPGVMLSGKTSPQTLISPAKRVKVASKTRFAASRVGIEFLAPLSIENPRVVIAAAPKTPPVTASSARPLTSVASIAPLPATSLPTTSLPTATSAKIATTATTAPAIPSAAPLSPRERMARLPSRGGLVSDRMPVELRQSAPEPAISESQRRLLAALDADLGRAQRRLDRAETRLTQGQRQLGAFTGVLQNAMFDAGEDTRGLHPFVRVAQRYMGTPYVWGGESARGFDCSGFIMRVMRDLGYSALPHSAAEQFRYGMPVARGLLKPGDIVFFANTYKRGVSHVGIYLGRGRFIHAANSQVGTIVSGLNEPKWVEHYAGARRLLPVKS